MQTVTSPLLQLLWQWLTQLGGIPLVLPLIFSAAGLLAWGQRDARRPVLHWLAALGLGIGLVAVSKVAFYGWGTGIAAWDLTCFSGHTMLAMSCWPMLAALMFFPSRWRPVRALAAMLGAILAVLVGWARVRTGAHPASEVIAGALLGGMVSAYALWALRDCTLAPARRLVLVPIFAVALAVTASPFAQMPSEQWMARFGAALSGAGQAVSRFEWRTKSRPPVDASPGKASFQALRPRGDPV
ncbi:PAP2 superfamily protein [Pseudoxanthomonas sp. GM95]|uniref:phosphatase PAP2 family protein n=1 Tax=Pseudoxanthomonas sp. GM95 TaxID=1881043 RepID=UPI0008D3364B|nr:phosphatase PAP2 family protein [Pseudoxanthomonas sp. GM95]SEM45524.1 PAP2 superfamily protein [Pseudoxanthomonas sp. GM95]